MKHLSLPLVALLFLLLTSCGAGRALREAHQCYARGEYHEAARQYRTAYLRTPTRERAQRGVLAYQQGECYRLLRHTLKAKAAYLNALRYRYPDTLVHYHLAQVLRQNGEYAAAVPHYHTYLAYAHHLPASAQRYDSLARIGLASAQYAQQWKQNPTPHQVKRIPIFLSRWADYAPMYAPTNPDLLYFTSTRNEAKGDQLNPITGMKSADLFLARRNRLHQWQKPQPLAGEVNSDFEEGACAFSPSGEVMYFTRCRTLPNAPVYAELYTSQRSDAQWGAPRKCIVLNDTLSSVAHPALSPTGHYLYFVSDMPGGQGGLDIWRVRLLPNGELSYVDNLGPDINTPGQEMFPTFSPDGTLYFSSDGHLGMGGLDLFAATEDSLTNRWHVRNLQSPLNSPADDHGLTFEPGNPHRGFFASNRNDARGADHLYSFELPQRSHLLQGIVYDRDGGPLPQAQVTLVGTDGTYLKLGVKADGSFLRAVSPGQEYALLATCSGYLNARQELHTDSAAHDSLYTLRFDLASITRPVLLEHIFYEFDRADLTPASSVALNDLIKLLNDNPTVHIELSAHCDYKGDEAYNLRLSHLRAQSVVRYLIQGGIDPSRLTPKGYGKQQPKTVTKSTLTSAPFLKEGDVLTPAYIKNLLPKEQEICNSLNRRTEFRISD